MVIVGIVGAGFMGTTHARAYRKLSGVRVKYIADQVVERSQQLAAELGAEAVIDINQLFDDPDLDLVDITLPTPFHPQMAITALYAGKHVIVEKPIALTQEAAEEMLAAARTNQRLLMVAHVLRFFPEYATIREIVSSGRLGKPLLGHAYRLSNIPQWADWFRDPHKTGGAALDLQIHDLDFLNWIFGNPLSVYAQGIRDEMGGWNSLLTTVEYASGAASIECSYMKPQDYPFTCGLRLQCERGDIEYHFRAGGASFEQGKVTSYVLMHEDGKPNQAIPIKPGDGFENELEYFTRCVENAQVPAIASADDAYLALNTALAAIKSLESGVKVVL